MGKVFLLLCALSIINVASAQREKERQIKDQLLGRNYDPTVFPSGENGTGPVHVNVSMHVKNILAVDDQHMTVKLQLLMRLKWKDPRFVYPAFPPNAGPRNITVTAGSIDRAWVPPIYFVNGVKSETDKSNQYMRIFLDDGSVEYSSLVKLTTSCAMNYRYYPHDTQNCVVKLSTYGHPVSDIMFNWDPNVSSGVYSNANSAASGFSVEDFDTETCEAETTSGVYSCLEFGLQLKRECGFYLTHVFIPCTMLIIISWLSYFLHPSKTATGRVIVSVSALGLAVIGISGFNLSTAPRVAYTKAIDVWTGVSLTFIFASLVEFVIVNYLNQYECKHGCEKKKKQIPDSSENAEQQAPLNPTSESSPRQEEGSNGNKWATLLDVIFRVVIPIKFLAFVITYTIVVFV